MGYVHCRKETIFIFSGIGVRHSVMIGIDGSGLHRRAINHSNSRIVPCMSTGEEVVGGR